MRSIFISYPWWTILLCVLTAFIYAAGMYYRFNGFGADRKHWNWPLAVCRALSIFFICFLLLQPYVKQTSIEEQLPTVIMAQDISQSIDEHFKDSIQKASYFNRLDQLKTDLKTKYEVDFLSFGEDVMMGEQILFSEKATNIGKLFDFVDQSYAGQPVAAMVMASDGLYNQGVSPVYKIESVAFPLHTIALGDTTQKKDVYIQKVNHNRLGYLGDQLRILVDLGAFNCKGEKTTLQITHKGKTVYQNRLDVTEKVFFRTVDLPIELTESGLQRYDIRLSTLEGEKTADNNSRSIFIEVIDTRQQLMILAAAPHPDLGALKRAIESNDNYDVEIQYLKNEIPSLDSVDMMILHQIPSPNALSSEIIKRIMKRKVPHVVVVGSQTDIATLNNLYESIEIDKKGSMINQVEAGISEQFSTFKLTESFRSLVKMAPPLNALFAEYTMTGNHSVLLHQVISGIPTGFPLLAFAENQQKIGFVLGTGIWKWRIVDFVSQENHDVFDEFINQVVQYISTKEDKKRFRTYLSKTSFTENEDVTIYAELYNPSYELVNSPDVSLSLIDELGNAFNYQMNKEDDTYRLDVKGLTEGVYSYRAQVEYAGQQFTSKGEFSVEKVQLEALNTTADLALLYTLGQQTNGQLFFDDQLDSLRNVLNNTGEYQTVLHESESTMPLIHYKILFLLILLLLSIEWFFRRYHGSY
jgi:hypothetical protein